MPAGDMREVSAHYDHEADALYVALRRSTGIDRTEEVDGVALDLYRGDVVGLEIVAPRLPLRLAKLAAARGFADALDDIYAAAAMALGVSASGPLRLTTSEAWLPGRPA